MATFSVLRNEDAPRTNLRRQRTFDGYVRSPGSGEVGRLVPAPGESLASLTSLIRAAARRARVRIETWTVDEVLYFRVLTLS